MSVSVLGEFCSPAIRLVFGFDKWRESVCYTRGSGRVDTGQDWSMYSRTSMMFRSCYSSVLSDSRRIVNLEVAVLHFVSTCMWISIPSLWSRSTRLDAVNYCVKLCAQTSPSRVFSTVLSLRLPIPKSRTSTSVRTISLFRTLHLYIHAMCIIYTAEAWEKWDSRW